MRRDDGPKVPWGLSPLPSAPQDREVPSRDRERLGVGEELVQLIHERGRE